MATFWRYGWFADGHPNGSIVRSSGGGILTGGKYYWEVQITSGGSDATSGYGIILGIAGANLNLVGTVITAWNANQPNSQYGNFINTRVVPSGESANAWGYPGRPVGVGAALAVNCWFAVAVDTVLHKVWWRNITNGGAWGGSGVGDDPATGSGGASFAAGGPSPILTPVHALVGCSHGSAAAKGAGLCNFGNNSFVGTVPTGFNGVTSGFSNASLNPNDNSVLVLSNNNLAFSGENVPVSFSPSIGGFSANVGFTNCCRSRFSIAQGP